MTQPDQPLLRKLLENPWILLVLGILVPVLSYTLWGWYEVFNIPPATLP